MSQPRILIDPATDAVIDVDVQPASMTGGGLAVNGGDLIVPVVKRVGSHFPRRRRFATLDKHPRGHVSLASSYVGLPAGTKLTSSGVFYWTEANHLIAPHAGFNLAELKEYLAFCQVQMLWPDHALDGSDESRLHPDLAAVPYAWVLEKGLDPCCDSYSGIKDNLGRPTGLGPMIKYLGVKRLFVTGLAFDFCVGWTALDAKGDDRDDGFDEVYVVEDATASVDLPGTVAQMQASLDAKGVKLISSDQLDGRTDWPDGGPSLPHPY